LGNRVDFRPKGAIPLQKLHGRIDQLRRRLKNRRGAAIVAFAAVSVLTGSEQLARAAVKPGDTFDIAVLGFNGANVGGYLVNPVDATFGTTQIFNGNASGGQTLTVASNESIGPLTTTDTITVSVPTNFDPPGIRIGGEPVTDIELDLGYNAGSDLLDFAPGINPSSLTVAGTVFYSTSSTLNLSPAKSLTNSNTSLGMAEAIGDTPDISVLGVKKFTITATYTSSYITHTWQSASNGIWTDTTRWAPASTPDYTDDAVFSLGSATGYSVNVTTASAANNLIVNNDNVTLNISSGQTLALSASAYIGGTAAGPGIPAQLAISGGGSVTAAGSVNVFSGSVLSVTGISNLSTGTLNISGGSVSFPSCSVSGGSGNTATIVNLTAGLMAVTGSLSAGSGGIFNMTGGTLSTSSMLLGSPSDFNWTGGTLNLSSGSFYIASGGTFGPAVNLGKGQILHLAGSTSATLEDNGSLNVSNGGYAQMLGANGNFWIGYFGSGSASVNGTGSTILATTFEFGVSGSSVGSLNVSGGGYAGCTTGFIGSSGIANVVVTGSGSELSVSSLMCIGYSTGGTGTFSLNNKGEVFSGTTVIGGDGGSGTLTLGRSGTTDTGAIFNSSGSIFAGGDSTSYAGSLGGGVVNVYSGTTLFTPGTLKVWNSSGTTVNLAGGTIQIGTLDTNGNPAEFNWSGGTLDITGSAGLSVTANGPLGAALNLSSGKSLIVANTLTNSGSITLNGGSLTANALVGNAVVFQTGSLSITGPISVGSGGNFGSTVTISANQSEGSTAQTTVTSSGVLNVFGGTITGNLANAGTLAITGTSEFTGPVTTSGNVSITNGTVTFTNGLSITGGWVMSDPSSVSITVLNISSGASYNASPGDQIIITGGNTFTNAGVFNDAGTLSAAAILNSGTFTVGNGLTETGKFNNSGTATISGPQNWSYGTVFTNTAGTAMFTADSGSTTMSPLNVNVSGGTVTFASTQHLASLSILSGATVQIPGGGTGSRSVLFTASLSVAGTLDLTGNDLDLQNGGSIGLLELNTLIGQGFSNGTWAGTGISSSTAAGDSTHLTAIGFIQNNQSGNALYTSSNLFDGITPGLNDVLAKYTYYGDANLDGKVDGSDYSLIDNGYLTQSTGWYNGDFNYDGVVNGSDYTLIDNAFNSQGAQLSTRIAGQNAGIAAQIAGTSGVPEPGCFFMMSILGCSLLSRRRSRLVGLE
jgi:hypothetical protein